MKETTIEQIDRRRSFYNKIINESEKGDYKNPCTYKNCNNRTVYKHQGFGAELQECKYYCNECINIKKTEFPM